MNRRRPRARPRIRRSLSAFLLPLLFVARDAAADDARDPAAAREHLKLGYELKKAGRCDEALPHFAESARLDPRAKPLLNSADCDEALGRLVAAEQQWVAGRDLARAQGDPIATYAEERLAALDKKMPRLTIRLAAAAPPGSVVLRDGVALGAVSLGVPLPIDPGDHVVTLRGPGLDDRTWSITAHEGDQLTVEATPTPQPGPDLQPLPPPRPPVVRARPSASHDPLAPEEWEASPFYTVVEPSHPARWAGWAFEGAAGAAAIGSVVFFARSSSYLGDIRDGGLATEADIRAASDAAHNDRAAAIALAVGAVVFVAAGLPFLLAPDRSADRDDARVRFTPHGVVF